MHVSLPLFAVGLTLAQAGWEEDAGFTLAKLHAGYAGGGEAWFTGDGGVTCAALWSYDDRESRRRWAACEPTEGGVSPSCAVLDLPPAVPEDLAQRCGRQAVEFAELARAGCEGGAALAAALANPRSLAIRGRGADGGEQESSPTHCRGAWVAERIGCAESAASPDGRVRTWTLDIAQEPETRPGKSKRGEAYLQWLDARERLHVERDGTHVDLGLDSVVEGIFPVPGQPRRYLFTGWRYLGFGGIRWAEVVDLSGARPRRVPQSFLVAGQTEDLLLIAADRPDTGKLRHSPIWNQWMRLRGTRLWLEPIPERYCRAHSSDRKPDTAYVLGTWDGSQFHVSSRGWARPTRVRSGR